MSTILLPEKPKISIHALREEGDAVTLSTTALTLPFLSTPSARRATNRYVAEVPEEVQFLSTPSARRATSRC